MGTAWHGYKIEFNYNFLKFKGENIMKKKTSLVNLSKEEMEITMASGGSLQKGKFDFGSSGSPDETLCYCECGCPGPASAKDMFENNGVYNWLPQ